MCAHGQEQDHTAHLWSSLPTWFEPLFWVEWGVGRQEYWSGLPFPSPGDLPDPGIEPSPRSAPAQPAPPARAGFPLLSAPLLGWLPAGPAQGGSTRHDGQDWGRGGNRPGRSARAREGRGTRVAKGRGAKFCLPRVLIFSPPRGREPVDSVHGSVSLLKQLAGHLSPALGGKASVRPNSPVPQGRRLGAPFLGE